MNESADDAAVYAACVAYHGRERMKQRVGIKLSPRLAGRIKRMIYRAMKSEAGSLNQCRFMGGDVEKRSNWRVAIGDKMADLIWDHELQLIVTVRDAKRRKRRGRRKRSAPTEGREPTEPLR